MIKQKSSCGTIAHDQVQEALKIFPARQQQYEASKRQLNCSLFPQIPPLIKTLHNHRDRGGMTLSMSRSPNPQLTRSIKEQIRSKVKLVD